MSPSDLVLGIVTIFVCIIVAAAIVGLTPNLPRRTGVIIIGVIACSTFGVILAAVTSSWIPFVLGVFGSIIIGAITAYRLWSNAPNRIVARQRRERMKLIETMPIEYITPAFISSERNIEVRNALIRRIGTREYIFMVGATKQHSDDWGTLYRSAIPGSSIGYAAVQVQNATKEPDGTYKDYWLRVPGVGTRQPPMFCAVCGRNISAEPPNTAKGAIAWTFRLCETHYNPAVAS